MRTPRRLWLTTAVPQHSFALIEDQYCTMRERPSVLVVDDVALVRLLVVDYLRASGFDAIEAANADDAMRMLESGAPIDVVFSDIVMPGTSDGLALASWVRVNHPQTKIVLGSGISAASERAAALGFGETLAKPYRQFALERRLREVLHAAD
jgi:CheY-like chemotaxis protein